MKVLRRYPKPLCQGQLWHRGIKCPNALKMNIHELRNFFMNSMVNPALFVIAAIFTLYLIGCIVAATIAESFRYTKNR